MKKTYIFQQPSSYQCTY